MNFKKYFLFILFIITFQALFPQSNPWGNIKMIDFYLKGQRYDQALEQLKMIDPQMIKESDKVSLCRKLVSYGDYFFNLKEYQHAYSFYKTVLLISSENWPVYNRLEAIDHIQGKKLPNINNTMAQFSLIFKDFKSSFIFITNTFNSLFFASILVLYAYAIFLFVKYFKLAGNDLLSSDDSTLSKKRVLMVIISLTWPIVFLSGWFFPPFLILGLMWLYLKDNEKKGAVLILIITILFSLFYSVNNILESSLSEAKFKKVQQVFQGKLFTRNEYEFFDDELKTIQALSYYNNGMYEVAADILASTSENYKTVLKFNLLGNINLKYKNISESLKYYRESLELNEKNHLTLNNFTFALLKNENIDVFRSYAKRYPQIEKLKKSDLTIKEIEISRIFLWKRLLNFSKENFSFSVFFKNLVVEFIKLPVIICLIIFFVYIYFLKRWFRHLGKSTYCSKCAKIIKEVSIHKSYKLCEECYQLFLIKDVIFLEAKMLKENELKKKLSRRFLVTLIFSFFIPGLNLNYKEMNRILIVGLIVIYSLLFISIFGMINFKSIYFFSPIIFNYLAIIGAGLYFLFNLFAAKGGNYGL